jgi:hypothetical protein
MEKYYINIKYDNNSNTYSVKMLDGESILWTKIIGDKEIEVRKGNDLYWMEMILGECKKIGLDPDEVRKRDIRF